MKSGALRRRATVLGAVAVVLGVSGALILKDGAHQPSGVIVFTQVPAGTLDASVGVGDMTRYPEGSRIVAFDPLAPEGGVRVLTEGFHSARAPALSPDGARMVFAGRRGEDAPWRIWEIELGSRRPRARLVVSHEGSTDPAYIAGGAIVFSAPVAGADAAGQVAPGDPGEVSNALFTAGPGAEPVRITFHPDRDFSPTMLRDGRLLFVTGGAATPSISRLFTMRTDGTAAELFYQSRSDGRPAGRAWEAPDERVVFIEQTRLDAPGTGVRGGSLVAISGRRPLHSRIELSSGMTGEFHSVVPLSSDEYVVSYRPPGADRYGLYAFEPATARLEPILEPDPGYDAIEAVVAVARPALKRFESVVDLQTETGQLYCLDADHSDLPAARSGFPAAGPGGASGPSATVRVRAATGTLGEVPLEADGSFYLELPADTPVQLETLDAAGRVVRGPSAWIWVRPNERRGCIGCHEDRELSPENRVPLAIEKPPVSLTDHSHQADEVEQ